MLHLQSSGLTTEDYDPELDPRPLVTPACAFWPEKEKISEDNLSDSELQEVGEGGPAPMDSGELLEDESEAMELDG